MSPDETLIPGDGFTQLVDADFDRVELVGRPANGRPVLVAKAEASTASMDERPDSDFAYVEPGGAKKDGKTTPLSLRHFPIYDAAHTRNALARTPQSEFGDKAMPKIKAAAEKFGIEVAKSQEDTMPDTAAVDSVAKDAVAESASDGADTSQGGQAEQLAALADHDADSPDAQMAGVVKAEGDEVEAAPDEVDLTETLAEGTGDGVVGDELVPGSPAWEDVDAATAAKWTAVLGRTRNAIETLAQRETIEADTGGDGDDLSNAFDLADAACAIDYAISVLAGYAADEKIEAVLGTEEIEAVGKAAAAIDPATLDVLEELGPVVKAGRVLSAANEGRIREAVDSLQTVLATLPAAPVNDVAKEEPVGPDTASLAHAEQVAKEDVAGGLIVTDSAIEVPAGTTAMPAAGVAKADDLSGKSMADLKRQVLTGSTSERNAALMELGLRLMTGDEGAAPADTTDEGAPDDTAATTAPGTDETAAVAAPPPPVASPAPDTTDDTSEEQPVGKAEDVLKAMIDEKVEAALVKRDEEHDTVVKALQARLDEFMDAPATPKVLANGVQRRREGDDRPLPEPHVLRGQNVGELRHEAVAKEDWAATTDVTERKEKGDQMQQAAADALSRLHGTRPPGSYR